MRKVKRDELRKIANFFAEQFYGLEPFRTAMNGIEPQKAKLLIAEKYYGQFFHSLYNQADIFVDGDAIKGAIIGIDKNKKSLFAFAPVVFDVLKIAFTMCSKSERRLILHNTKTIKEVQNAKWYKKHCTAAPYYLALFAIDTASRGKGLCREMLESFFDHAKTRAASIVLETHTATNVPLYEHFGFVLAESKKTADGTLTEYRMIKKFTE